MAELDTLFIDTIAAAINFSFESHVKRDVIVSADMLTQYSRFKGFKSADIRKSEHSESWRCKPSTGSCNVRA